MVYMSLRDTSINDVLGFNQFFAEAIADQSLLTRLVRAGIQSANMIFAHVQVASNIVVRDVRAFMGRTE